MADSNMRREGTESSDPPVDSKGTVRQIEVPPAARALSTLTRIDYEDAFVVELERAQDRTPEQWAQAIVGEAPAVVRSALLAGWSALGLRLDPGRSGGSVLGWEVRRSTREFALLGASSRIGLPAELLFKRRRRGLLFATFVQQENPIARTVWAGVEPMHPATVQRLLERAARSDQHRA
jgi:hypothetical protein